jgi:hypothetical protein
LANDGEKRAGAKLGVIRHWHGNGRFRKLFLHLDVASAPTNLRETMSTNLRETMFSQILQTSMPESIRSLPNLNLDPSDENLAAQAALDLARIGSFQKELERLDQVRARFLDGAALAGDIQLWAESGISSSLPFDDCCELACLAQVWVLPKV